MTVEQPKSITTLEDMCQNQDYLQTEVYGDGTSPTDFIKVYGPSAGIQFYKDMHVALVDELHEALAEIGWKPWASSMHFNQDAVRGELVDAFHFFMNLCLVSGVSAQDLIDGYIAKSAQNIKRQADGYDGVSTKCTRCKRALDDPAVHCTDEICDAD